jgi:hypothetical protein
VVIQSRGVRVLKRPVEVKTDVPRAPCIVKADIKKMRAQGELDDNADLVEFVAAAEGKSLLDRRKKAFGSMVPNTAELPPVFGSPEWHKTSRDTLRRFEVDRPTRRPAGQGHDRQCAQQIAS